MKKWGWIAVVTLVLLGVGFAWFWSLAAVKAETAPEITLRVERAPVRIKALTDADFHDASTGVVLTPGTVIRTGDGGRAVIVFFGQAESRLDANAEITVAEAVTASNGETNVRLELGTGRVWSRVLRLFDLGSSFEVKTSSVVATVRGTAFDVRANADGTSEVWVSESAVEVIPVLGERRAPALPSDDFRVVTSTPVLTAGESSLYGKDGKPQWRKPISAEDRASAWFTENRMADELFLREARERRRDELNGQSGRTLDGLTRLSERVHLAVAKKGEDREEKASAYSARRLASAIAEAEAGRTGRASQVFSRFENDMKSRLNGADGERERHRLVAALRRASPLLEDVAPSNPVYPFKQRVEDMLVEAAETDQANALYARLRTADARLDEAARLLDAGTFEEAQTALTAAHGGLENARRDLVVLLPTLDARRQTALSGKILALVARDVMGHRRLDMALHPVAMATSTDVLAPTSTRPVIVRPVPTVTSTVPVGTSAYSSIGASAQPNPAQPNTTVKLYALATKVGGGTEDVTARSSFRLISGAAAISGNTVTPTAPGTVVIEAEFIDQGKKMISRVPLTVSGGLASLDALNVSAAPAAPKAGERVTLSAMAHYTNNLQKDVSGIVAWKNLDPTLGTIAGNIFTPSTTASGQAQIQATYTEDGVTKTAIVYVTVTAQAATRTYPYN